MNSARRGTPKRRARPCAGTPTDAGDFINIPLSQIQVIFTSLPGTDVTKASIVCSDSAGAITNPPDPRTSENGAADPAFDDTNETFTNLVAGTYNCQIIIDP